MDTTILSRLENVEGVQKVEFDAVVELDETLHEVFDKFDKTGQ